MSSKPDPKAAPRSTPTPAATAPPRAGNPSRARETPGSLVQWIARQQERGSVERYELQLLSSTSNPRIVDDYDAKEGGGAAEQLADLIWARALEDSENAPELSSIYYGVQSVVSEGVGALKRFTVPTPSRVDGRPLEPANEQGLLSIGMRGLNKSNEAAQLFVIETARQMGDSFDRTQIGWGKLAAVYEGQVRTLTDNFETQLEWTRKELERVLVRNAELEARSLANFRLAEELQGAKHERELALLKQGAAEERKDAVAKEVIGMLPLLGRKFAQRFGGLGAAPGDADANGAPPPGVTAPMEPPFNLREQLAIKAFLSVLQKTEFLAIQSALAETPARMAFDALIGVLFEESQKRDEAEQAAAAKANGTNGASHSAPGGAA